jgi:hypothetical protein
MIAFIAGKYTGKNEAQVNAHIDVARAAAIRLWELGYTPICPHLNSAHFEDLCKVEDQVYYEGYLELVHVSDILVLLPNWKDSRGAVKERDLALDLGIFVIEYADIRPAKDLQKDLSAADADAFADKLAEDLGNRISDDLGNDPGTV